MDDHSSSSLTTSINGEVISKNDLMQLQGVDLKPSDAVGDNFQAVTNNLHSMHAQINGVPSNIQIICDTISCPCPCPSGENQNSHNLLDETNSVLSADKNLKLNGYATHEPHENLHIDNMTNDTSNLAGPLDTQQYYNQIHSQPIMVYGIPSSNILPFDSLVPVSVSLEKNVNKKVLDGLNLLQSAVDITDGVYSQHSRPMSPFYILPDKNNSNYNKVNSSTSHSNNSVKMESEFNYITGDNYESPVPTTESNEQDFSLATNIYHTSTDTDSEVALTLASLGNLKPEEKNKNCDQLKNTMPDNSDVIKVASILSSVANQHQFNRLSTSWPDTFEEPTNDMKPESKSTLVLRSRRSRGTTSNPHYNDFTMEDPEKIGRRKKKKIKITNNKFDNDVLLKMSNDDILNMEKNLSNADGTQGMTTTSLKTDEHSNGNTFPTSIIHYDENHMGLQVAHSDQSNPGLGMTEIVPEQASSSMEGAILTSNETVMMSNSHLQPRNNPVIADENPKENLLGQLLKASEHCEPATLIPEGVVDDVIPAVGHRIMDMSNLGEMIQMMHRCSGSLGSIVIQEQASLREGAVSQLSIICTGCQEGTVCATSNKTDSANWNINNRVEQLRKEFDIKEDQIQRMLEILGIFYRPCKPMMDPPPTDPLLPTPQAQANQEEEFSNKKKKRKKKADGNTEEVVKKKNFECKVCKEKFFGENHLKKHMNSHDYALHTCPYCHAYFKKPFNLQEHVKKHENFKFQCPHCSVAVTDRSTLRLHIKSKHEKKFELQCLECSKKFYHKQHLNEHMRVHTKEKPYKCEICSKQFSWHDSLKKHMHTHSAGSKYECRLCGKWFRWLQAVRQHLQQQHKLKKSDVEAQIVNSSTDTGLVLSTYQIPNPVSSITLHPSQLENGNQVTNNFHTMENVGQESNVQQEDLAMFTISDQNWPVYSS